MVREYQISTAPVYSEALSKVLHAHRRAFDMPARATLTPRRWPGWLAVLLRLPQHEVEGIALQRVRRKIAPFVSKLKLRDIREAAKRPEAGVVLDVKVHVAIGGISASFGEQSFDDPDDLPNVARGARFEFWPQVVRVVTVRGDVS